MVLPYLDTGQAYTYLALIPFLICQTGRLLCLFKLCGQVESNLLFTLFSRELVAPHLPFRGRRPHTRSESLSTNQLALGKWGTMETSQKPKPTFGL
jgi:hypothetical protein